MLILVTNTKAVIFLRTPSGIERFRRIDGSEERVRRAVVAAQVVFLEGAFGAGQGVLCQHSLKPVPDRSVPLRLLRQDSLNRIL